MWSVKARSCSVPCASHCACSARCSLAVARMLTSMPLLCHSFCCSYGPRASSKLSTPFSERGQFLVDVKFAPFAGSQRRARRGAQVDADERRLQTQLTEALTVSIHLEAFPKAVLEAFVTILQDDGSQWTSCTALQGALCQCLPSASHATVSFAAL